jgi:uncharacterized lipoprotein YehR (DUF1307 family)
MIKSKKLAALANTDFITPEQAEYLEQCVEGKKHVIIAGHKGHGILILLSHLLTCIDIKANKVKQVKNIPADFEAEASYYVVGDIKEQEMSYGDILTKLFSKEGAVLCLKDPDHTFSLMKVIRDVAKQTEDYSKEYIMVECTKVDDVKHVAKVTKLAVSPQGKILKEDIFSK